jgi:UDP-2,3-diacylglucosamine pyrophosphatase LpxH
MSDESNNKNGKGKWVAIVSTILSFAVGVIFAAYVLGQRTGKVLDLQEWKTETVPRLERMDSKGTLSFEGFHDEYLRTQARQEAMLIELEREIHDKQISDIKERLLTLERKQ